VDDDNYYDIEVIIFVTVLYVYCNNDNVTQKAITLNKSRPYCLAVKIAGSSHYNHITSAAVRIVIDFPP
jgi:hypothetical protein